jgi:serine/threonine protein kinase
MKTKKGGRVLGSGGFGCIFRPSLRCKTRKNVPQNNRQITKLMKNKHARNEFREINKYRNMLKDIPRFEDYFLLDNFTLCRPDTLSESDLELFEKKCSALKKIDINEHNINDNLDKIMALNMPYGGIDIGDYILQVQMNYASIHQLNNSLVRLFKYGVLEMNRRGVYHCDIKESNILVDGQKARLIDWGLSASFHPGTHIIPRVLLNRPFQFNIPFSNVLFNRYFSKMYREFLQKTPNPDYEATRGFVISFFVFWVDRRGKGHLKQINNLFNIFFEKSLDFQGKEKLKEEFLEFEYTFHFIFDYITKILVKFTKNGDFQRMHFFSSVFLKNVDIWGMCTAYFPILEKLYKYYDHLTHSEIQLFNHIKELVIFVYSIPDEPINPSVIIRKMLELNPILLKAHRRCGARRDCLLGPCRGHGSPPRLHRRGPRDHLVLLETITTAGWASSWRGTTLTASVPASVRVYDSACGLLCHLYSFTSSMCPKATDVMAPVLALIFRTRKNHYDRGIMRV